MTGKISIEGVKDGLAVACEIENVSLSDKFHILHVVEQLLEMSDTELKLYELMGRDFTKASSMEIRMSKDLFERMQDDD